MAGYPVMGVKTILYDGSYHPLDSSEMAFKTAAIQAFMLMNLPAMSRLLLMYRRRKLLQLQKEMQIDAFYSID